MQGALCALLATFTAAVLAFQLSRRVGQSLADSAAGREVEETKSSGFLNRVEEAIDSGSFQQQVVAVTLLRLTPVVPFRYTPIVLETSLRPGVPIRQSVIEFEPGITWYVCMTKSAVAAMECIAGTTLQSYSLIYSSKLNLALFMSRNKTVDIC